MPPNGGGAAPWLQSGALLARAREGDGHVGVVQPGREGAPSARLTPFRPPAAARTAPAPAGPSPAPAAHDAAGAARDREFAALRREIAGLRDEVARLRECLQRTDGELGFAMLSAGRLRGRLEREVEARESLERRLADSGLVVLPGEHAQSAVPSRSRRAAARSGTRSFLTDVDT